MDEEAMGRLAPTTRAGAGNADPYNEGYDTVHSVTPETSSDVDS